MRKARLAIAGIALASALVGLPAQAAQAAPSNHQTVVTGGDWGGGGWGHHRFFRHRFFGGGFPVASPFFFGGGFPFEFGFSPFEFGGFGGFPFGWCDKKA